MNITEVRVKLVAGSNEERLRAFCSVTLDGAFVIRDLKVIDGVHGPFVAMPSRKLADRCPSCGGKNHLRAKYCNECGNRLNENRASRDAHGRVKLHADVAHPINMQGRELIQGEVIRAYEREQELAKQPGYRPTALDDDDLVTSEFDDLIAELKDSPALRASTHREGAALRRTDGVTLRSSHDRSGAPYTGAPNPAEPSGGRVRGVRETAKGLAPDDPFNAGIL